MADVFISYKREDRDVAQRLSNALESLGFDVWWDMDLLAGERYRNAIRAVIDQCAATVVLWSTASVESDFVLDEATHAKSQGKLCPSIIDNVEIPFGFGQIHADDLISWDGELTHPGFQRLVKALEDRIGRKGRLASGRSAHQQAAASELDAFKAAQVANNVSALKTFLRNYPRGAFASFVRGQIQTMQGGDAPPPPRDPYPEPRPTGRKLPVPLPWILGGAGALVVTLALLVFVNSDQFAELRATVGATDDQAGRLKAILDRARASELAVQMAGDWRRVSGSDCATGYRIGFSRGALTRRVPKGSDWSAPTRASEVVDDTTVAFDNTQLRVDQDRLFATNPNWSGECEFARGAPSATTSDTPSSEVWRNMVGDWQRVSGSNCSRGYRIARSGDSLTRAFYSGTSWGSPAASSSIVGDDTVAWGDTRLRYSGGRIYVSNSGWSSGCEFIRGAPPQAPTWRRMVGDWRKLSGSSCADGYRIGLSGDSLTRAFSNTSGGWGTPSTSTSVVNDTTVAWGNTRLRYSGGRIHVSNSGWSSGCEFARGAPARTPTWRSMVGDWRKLSGSSCADGYRIGLSGDSLTRAFSNTSGGWGTPSTSTSVVNDTTVAWGNTRLRYSGGRIHVSNSSWSSGCEFVRGAPPSGASAPAWRSMVGDWRRVSGTMCSQGYRIALSGSSLSRAFASGSGWGSPATATSVVNDSTVAWGTTRLRYSAGRIYVSDSRWSSGCEFTRGAPAAAPSAPGASAVWRGMVGDWRRVSGTMCSRGYRIALSGSSLSRAFFSDPNWGTPSNATSVVNSNTVAWGSTRLRYSGGRIYVSDSNWSSGCEFVRGAPAAAPSAPGASAAWRNMVGTWRKVSGSPCSSGYRIASSGGTLTRAFYTNSRWGAPATASRIVNSNTVAWGNTQLRYSGGRIYVTNSSWSSSCQFVRGSP